MISIEIEFLSGVAHLDGRAAGRYGQPEYPPHPDRLFQAMVAAWGRNGCDQSERASLEWLERQDAPGIFASATSDRPTLKVFSPTNDKLKLERNKELLQSSTVPDVPFVTYIWDADLPEELRVELDSLLQRVTYVGRSESLVRARVVEGGEPSLIPDDEFGDILMRVPHTGRLAELVDAFENGIRPVAAGWSGYRKPGVRHSSGEWSKLLPFEVVGPVDLQHCVRLSRAVRTCLLSACPDPIPAWISGHDDTGDRLRDSHVGIVPLANVGHRHADGKVLGIGILIPKGISSEDQLRAFSDFCKEPQRIGHHITLQRVASARLTTSAARWTKPSRHWGTITPIACSRWAKKGEVADVVIRDIKHAGLPIPSRIITSRTSPVQGGHYGRIDEAPKRFRTHATICFEDPVSGPIAIGAGRYLGMGFCAPIAGSEQP